MPRAAANSLKREGPVKRGSRDQTSAPATPAPVHPVLRLQEQVGNQAVQHLLHSQGIQAKLAIGSLDDPAEREAEDAADTIFHGTAHASPCACTATGDNCEKCQKKSVSIQRRASGPTPSQVPASVTKALRTPGRPLDRSSRAFFEPRFGCNFGHVKVHTESEAAESARSIQAHAYTAGEHLVFGTGQYSPGTEAGDRLLAHELAHVVQQSSDTKIRREPDPDPPTGQPAAFEPEQAVVAQIETLDLSNPWGQQDNYRRLLMYEAAAADWADAAAFDQFIEDCSENSLSPDETKDALKNADAAFQSAPVLAAVENLDAQTAGPNLRLMLLLQTAKDQWKDRSGFPALLDECAKAAATEDTTIAELGLDDLSDPGLSAAQEDSILAQGQAHVVNPEAFPETWGNYLGKYLTSAEASNYPRSLKVDAEQALAAMTRSGDFVPGDILQHGLPLDFPSSLQVQGLGMFSIFGSPFYWSASPSGGFYGDARFMLDFLKQASKYRDAVYLADFTGAWIKFAASVVQQVKDGELSVDPASYVRYKHRRPYGVSLQEAPGLVTPAISPPHGRMDPAFAESFVTNIAGLTAFGKSFEHSKTATDMAAELMSEADTLIAKEDPWQRLDRARDWGHYRGFYDAALEKEWNDIKEHWVDIAEDMGKDIAKYAILEAIPGVNVITNMYLGLQLLGDIVETGGDLLAADQEARDAKTAPQLQRAAAHQATAASSAARKVASAIAMHVGTKVAHAAGTRAAKAGGNAYDRITKGPMVGEPEGGRTASDPTDTRSNAKPDKETAKQEAKPAEKRPDTDRLPDEPSVLLKDGDVRVNEEGHCKICHSPCRLEMDMAREVLRAVAGTHYEGYAENLAMRIRLLDEAMQSSINRGEMARDFKSRFAGALRKVSDEVDAAHERFVGLKTDVKLPAADEIDDLNADRDKGIMNDPKPRHNPERALEGTAYHDRIKAYILRQLPPESVFTEDTIQEYLRRQGVDARAIPKGSTGIDVYVLDNARNLIVPVDITNIAGGKSHVNKLHGDVTAMRTGLERVGLHLAEPIEIEYVGQTFDEAAASIVAELRAFARPPAPARGR